MDTTEQLLEELVEEVEVNKEKKTRRTPAKEIAPAELEEIKDTTQKTAELVYLKCKKEQLTDLLGSFRNLPYFTNIVIEALLDTQDNIDLVSAELAQRKYKGLYNPKTKEVEKWED